MEEGIERIRKDVSSTAKVTFMDSLKLHSHKNFINYINSQKNIKVFLFG